ncbi:Zn-ribbon domain-containing OB-fold protein [Sphingopyxis flava]|uniref:DUF35 domain-containing protein n=1 Tax=Sphingopyxis flava TaxID=1507287 RepID=A0A1T5FM15_9SPHN|nr:OB-fold domain-containing protein [Sphingopyxis flava]SKB97122.1 hypothetical protein SAMN06295937_10396 [Sphingopyxis flava]
MAPSRPLPQLTVVNAPFWAGCREHRLRLPRCRDCGLVWFPIYERCTRCTSTNLEWIDASGRGVLWGWIEMHKGYIPWFADKLPYNVALIRLDEGPMIYSNIIDARFEDLRADLPVEVVFDDIDDTISLPQFRILPS